MKAQKFLAMLLLLVLAGMSTAFAHGGRGSVGVYFGPYWGPGFYPSPYYYPSPVVVVPATPPVYIEQREAPAEAVPQYWYYCDSSQGYYPYVKECPGGWQKVLPQPPR